jgi:hypothetical protein
MATEEIDPSVAEPARLMTTEYFLEHWHRAQPVLTVEFLSPNDTQQEINDKIDEYLDVGHPK